MEHINYDAFISYRHQSPDQEIAKALHTAIETYGIPAAIKKQTGRKRMGKVFRDQEELPLSSDLGADIETALDRSAWFIAICSPRYLESRWCLREMEYFIAEKGRDRVLTVLAEGEPKDSFPEMIRFAPNEAGELVETEPLAANVRGVNLKESLKKLKNEKLRILAPMLGLSFDDLKRRARQRKIRIAATAAAIALVVAVGVATFLVINHANNERLKREAAEQAKIAAEQAALAEERQKLAEEQAKLAEQQRLLAVGNEIGEILEKADAARAISDKRNGAALLLDAYAKSEENGGIRHDEILERMRKTAYVEPFSVISGFTNQNVRLTNITPSPDGRTAIGVENQNAVALIDLKTNEVRYRVSVSNQHLGALRFSPDGSRFLAQCDEARTVCVWDTETGELLYTYTSKKNQQYHVANALFFQNSDTLLIQDMTEIYRVTLDGTETLFYTIGDQQDGYDYELNLLTVLIGKSIPEMFTFYTDEYTMTNVIVSADGSRILVSGRDGTTGTIILDENGRRVCLLAGMPAASSEEYTLSPDGRYAACISGFGFVAWWDVETGNLINVKGVPRGSFSKIAFSPDSSRLALVSGDHLMMFDPASEDGILDGTLESTNISPEVCFSADGNYLFVAEQHLYIIDAQSCQLYEKIEGTFSAAYANAIELGDAIFLTRNDGTAYLCSTPALATVKAQAAFDGELLPSYQELSLAATENVPVLKTEHELSEGFLATTAYSGAELYPQMYYSMDGAHMAIGYADGVIELFRTDGDGTVDTMLAQLTAKIAAIGMTEDVLAASDNLRRVLFYDMNENTVIKILNTNNIWYSAFAFDPAGEYAMALRSDGRTIDVYELHTAELLFTMRSTDAGGFTGMAFSSDGAYAVGLSANGCCVADMLQSEEAALKQTRVLAELFN